MHPSLVTERKTFVGNTPRHLIQMVSEQHTFAASITVLSLWILERNSCRFRCRI